MHSFVHGNVEYLWRLEIEWKLDLRAQRHEHRAPQTHAFELLAERWRLRPPFQRALRFFGRARSRRHRHVEAIHRSRKRRRGGECYGAHGSGVPNDATPLVVHVSQQEHIRALARLVCVPRLRVGGTQPVQRLQHRSKGRVLDGAAASGRCNGSGRDNRLRGLPRAAARKDRPHYRSTRDGRHRACQSHASDSIRSLTGIRRPLGF